MPNAGENCTLRAEQATVVEEQALRYHRCSLGPDGVFIDPTKASALRSRWLPAAVVFLVVSAVYWPATQFEFVDVDDDVFVFANPQVLSGLTSDSARWAFTTAHAGNWLPLTFLSLMADREVWGDTPAGHHTTNVLLHALNAALLLWVVRKLGATWRWGVFVALAFALHPLRVESVAWISERKDVLSTLFWFASTLAYLHWLDSRRRLTYVVMALLLACGLLSKAMLVTVPFTFLLLDWWPLDRPASWRERVVEKLPLFALCIAAAGAAVWAQGEGGAISEVSRLSLGSRFANALVAIGIYLRQTVWPTDLTYLYLHPALRSGGGGWPFVQVLTSGGLLVVLTAGALWLARRGKTPVLWGWLWFLGTLVPVIGLVQIGVQSHADRYTYVPSLGLVVAVAGGLALLRGRPWLRVGLGLALLVGSTVATVRQLPTWRDSEALLSRAIALDADNYYALTALGVVRARGGQASLARPMLQRAVQLSPNFVEARVNLGNVLYLAGELPAATEHLRVARELDPESFEAALNLGNAWLRQGRPDLALVEYQAAGALNPGDWRPWLSQGLAHMQRGDGPNARRCLEQARRLAPGNPQVQQAWQRLSGIGG